MKSPLNKISLRLVLSIAILAWPPFQACQEEELPLSEIQFSLSKKNVTEGSEATINLSLSKATVRDGSIHVNIEGDATYGQHYTTEPAINNGSLEIAVAKGQTSAQFKVKTIDNTLFGNSKFISFTLTNPSDGLHLGNLSNFVLTISDDDASLANFSEIAGTVPETEPSGIVIPISLSPPTKGTGSMTVTFNSAIATYGRDFITSPAAAGNSITLNIFPNEPGASFTVLPVHNYIATQNLQIAFSISSVSGVVQKGTSLTYSLTIINEDPEALVNFAVNSGSLNEDNAEGTVLEIPFSAQAPGEGSITISFIPVNASYGGHFTTIPAAVGNTITLNVAANQTSASFKVLPINNSYCSNPDRHIDWKISFANGSVKKGNNLDYMLALKDDEEISVVTFAESAGTVMENNPSGIVVHLNLSKPAKENALIYVSPEDWNDSKYGTDPGLSCDYSSCYIQLNVTIGSSGADFTVLPVNNAVKNVNYTVRFNMSAYNNSGCLTGADTYTLTIVDDD